VGAFDSLLWHVFQNDGLKENLMITTEVILMAAVIVFLLMVIGMILTMNEFEKISEDPSQRKGSGSGKIKELHS